MIQANKTFSPCKLKGFENGFISTQMLDSQILYIFFNKRVKHDVSISLIGYVSKNFIDRYFSTTYLPFKKNTLFPTTFA